MTNTYESKYACMPACMHAYEREREREREREISLLTIK